MEREIVVSGGGKFTLVNAVLGAVPVYRLAMYQLPVGIIKKLEQ